MHPNARAIVLVVIAAAMSSCASGASPPSSPPSASSAPTAGIANQTPEIVEGVLRWSVSEPHGIGYGMDAIWLVGHHSTEVYRIDPATNEMTGFVGAP